MVKIDLRMTNFTLKWYFTPKFSVKIAKNVIECTILGKKRPNNNGFCFKYNKLQQNFG